jgi:hypothetical protein
MPAYQSEGVVLLAKSCIEIGFVVFAFCRH